MADSTSHLNGHASSAAPSHSAIVLHKGAPLDTARTFLELFYNHDAARTLHHQQGIFTAWVKTHYREALTEEIRADLYRFLEAAETPGKPSKKNPDPDPVSFNPNTVAVNNVLDALRSASQLPITTRAPAWIEDEDGVLPPANEIISCKNGLLHLPSGRIYRHSPNFYSTSALAYDHNADAEPPKEWLSFLTSVWGDDADSIAALQDVFGYLLGTDTDQQKIPLLVGPKRSGKGTIARVLTALLGQQALVSPTLTSLESNFGMAPLIGKAVALIADARMSSRADQHVIAEKLLSVSGEDMQTIDRKNLPAWTGRLSARFFIMTNELPRITDSSGALASRFVILTMTKSFLGSEDHGLTNRLLDELPGILNWAIEGWRRLRSRGYFVQPGSSDEAMRELEDLSSPIGAFIRDRCVVQQGLAVSVDTLFTLWGDWCREQGRDYTGTKQTFGRDVRSAVPGMTITHPRTADGRTRQYEGIGLKGKTNEENDELRFN